MDFDDHNDDAWALLGKARKTEPDPFFARNVIREIRLSEDKQKQSSSPLGIFFNIRKILLLAAVTTCIAFTVTIGIISNEKSSSDLAGSSDLTLKAPPVDVLEKQLSETEEAEYLLAINEAQHLDDEDILRLLF